ncbi:MAG: PAS domain S-box protein [Candidatus Hydrogenedentes bacterium]|nr:PAS domain S-box protein [Candidatus Hydrogenedentota bacterium]
MKIKRDDIVKILESSSVCWVITDLEGNLLKFSEGFITLIGFHEGGVKRKFTNKILEFVEVVYPYRDSVYHPDRFSWFQVWEIRNLDGKGARRFYVVAVRFDKDNNQSVLFLLFPVLESNREFLGFYGADLTHLMGVIKSLPIVVLQVSRAGKILFVNEYVKKITGWDVEELVGQDWTEKFLPDEIRDETVQMLDFGGEGVWEPPSSIESEILTKSGERLLVQWACLPLKLNTGSQETLLMLGQEISSKFKWRFVSKSSKYFKSQAKWICEEVTKGVPEEEAFTSLLKTAIEIAGLEAGLIYKLVKNRAIAVAYSEIDKAILEKVFELELSELDFHRIFSTDDVIEVDITSEGGFWSDLYREGFIKSFAVPIFIGDKPIGFSLFFTTRREVFLEEYETFLRMFSVEVKWLYAWYRVQEVQRRQGRQYELLERMLPYALLAIDEQGTIISCNKGGLKLLGGDSEEDILNRKVTEFLPEWNTFIKGLKSGEELRAGDITESEIINANGEKFPVELIAGHFTLASRSFYLLFFRDITWRKQAIEALQRAEEKYRELFENANDIVYTHDLKGKFTSLNKAALTITGYTREEAENLTVYDLVAPEYLEEVKERIRQKLLGSPPTKYEVEVIAKNGERIPLEVSTRVIYDKGIPIGIQGIARDIRDRKRAEQERKRMEAHLLHTQKLESLGILAGGIAHDFNNILVGILGNAGLALSKLPEDSPSRTYVKRIEESAYRAAELTNQMLAYAGKGVRSQQFLNLTTLVKEMIPLLSAVISKKAQLEFNCDPNLPIVQGDSTQIHQVLMNLLINASEALGDNPGKIMISTRVTTLSEEQIKKSYFIEQISPGEYVCLEVSDTGCGIPPENLGKIFDPFFTTKFTGRGLGLASVLGIVRAHGGTIHVYSEVGKGSSFKVYFPVVRKNEEVRKIVRKEEDSQVLANWKGSGKVLVADDEIGVLEVAGETLKGHGFYVVYATNGKDAFERFKEKANELTLVILDLTMPEMDGYQVFNEIYKIRPDIPVIICSGFTEYDISKKFVERKPAGFLQKPYHPLDLIKAVKKIIEP